MKIFISYSHKDDSLFQELVDGLAGLRFLIPPPLVWHDKLIPLASEWDEEIRAALHAADLVLLLVSRDFMKSQYIWEKEMTPALARHEAGQCKVLPIILRHTAAWEQSPFGKLQAAFRGKPVSGSPNKRDKAWKEIIEGVIALAEQKTTAAVSIPPAPQHHLPIPRNRLFTGRDDDLKWIADTLASGRPAALLHGMGGVGKTQTAAEYAHRHADSYKVAWWVAAQTGAEADAGYGALAEVLKLPGYDPRNNEQTRQAVLGWMARESGWLVVLDNAESPKDLAPWLPATAKGHLLITSRNGNWANRAAVHDLDVWSISQAADFLLERSGDNDRAAAEKLGAALGCLPLACETAAAYVAETGGSLARYAELLAKQPVKLLDFLPQDTIYARSLPQVIHLATEAVERESSLAAEILRALAWLAPDNIPRWLLDP
ncbi:MAG TPA: toll/interleukin-1 receptor domain-containing protein [Azospirillaceae bacterium]|nr:toll/interleukin-1 receptor domain-containing protein [Azospirillaceae bacterium]